MCPVGDLGMKLELHTERLLLTPLVADDIDLALEMYTDPEVLEHTHGVMTEAEIRREMPNFIKRGGNGGIGVWCIKDRDTGEKLGETYLLPLPIDEDHTDFSLIVMGQIPDAEIEIGYFLKRSAWGRGYATEACKRLLRFAFEETTLDEIVASVYEDNAASKKVLEKSGLIFRGRTRCYGKYSPIYSITRNGWAESQRAADFSPPKFRSASAN